MEQITRRAAIGILAAGTAGLGGSEAQQQAADRAAASLAGEWRFKTDPDNTGLREAWFRQSFTESLTLPGSLATNDKGVLNTRFSADGLNAKYVSNRGGVWYQREIEAPASWAGRRVAVVLERSGDSRVWIDGREAGEQQSGPTPHVHELGELVSPGRHTLTILAGSALPGRNEIVVTDRVWVRHIKAVPNVAGKAARLTVEVANETKATVKGSVRLSARSFNSGRTHEPAPVNLPFEVAPGRRRFEVELALQDGMLLWDEFQPALYRLTASLNASGARASYADRRETTFGMRELSGRGARMRVNGRTVLLRGRSNGAGSPLTGLPPFDVEGWREYFRNNKDYGLNHLRAGWPPEAAFEAADLEGVYLQAEPGVRNPVTADRVEASVADAATLLETYGNHPSLCLITLGNELYGDPAAMSQIVSRMRSLDSRHLYATGSNNFYGVQEYVSGDDFWVTWRTRRGTDGNVRASYSCADLPEGHLETGPPNTERDFSKALEGVPVPVVAHEIGQYQVYPNYDELPKYTGVMLPRNLEIFRDKLVKAGMIEQWKDFFRASGALAVLCYKEDIEAAHRTSGFGGYQILDLADCHTQGTALVGILDAFNESKGLITAAEWREFCNSTVPLLRFAKFVWTAGETFTGSVQVAHYGPADLPNAVIAWSVKDQASRVMRSGEMPPAFIPQGDARLFGSVSFPLANLPTPARYDVELSVRGTPFKNRWPIWVYESSLDAQPPAGVKLARKLDIAAQQKLVEGDTILLLPDADDLVRTTQMAGRFVDGQFQADFWSYSMFQTICSDAELKPSPGTLGLLMDPKHPALARFPTEYHTNWQWWNLIKNGRAVVLDEAPAGYRPIVQVIDNVNRNYKLGLVFEFRVGKGRLLVCTADLLRLKDRPEAAQFLRSLLAYAGSAAFQPATGIDLAALKRIMGILVVHA